MFIGRCIPIPAVKHIITIPAGLSRMDLKDFIVFNALGGFTFSSVMVFFGYFFGQQAGVFLKRFSFTILLLALIVFFVSFVMNVTRGKTRKM